MRFIKGDFKDIQCNDISVETTCHKKEIADSDFYPSAEIAWTRDNNKSRSTTTTANRLDKENSGKYSQIRGLVSKPRITNEESGDSGDKISSSHKENEVNRTNDPTFSPPLARQLFSKHGLFDCEEIEEDHQLTSANKHQDCLKKDENSEKVSLSLHKISEAPESRSSNSSSKTLFITS